MPKTSETYTANREAIVISAMLTQPNIAKVAKATGVSERTIYKMLKSETFQEQLTEARKRATDEAINYLQGNLNTCAEALIEIIKDKENNSAQVRINAINSVFNNLKALNTDSERTIQGMAVKIIDSI